MKISQERIREFLPVNGTNTAWATNVSYVIKSMVTTTGFFNDPILDENHINNFCTAFRGYFNLISVSGLKSFIMEKLLHKINNKMNINIYDDITNMLIDFCAVNSIENMMGFNDLPDNIEELSPLDFKDIIVDCISRIYVCNDSAMKTTMKNMLFSEIIPNMMTYIMDQMTFLEELEDEEFNALFDEIDELGYLIITASKLIQSILNTSRGLDDMSPTKIGCSIDSEYSAFIKYVYEGSMSPWTFFMTPEDFDSNLDNLIKTNPKAVLSSMIEWKVNFKEVSLVKEVSNENILAVKRFLCIED